MSQPELGFFLRANLEPCLFNPTITRANPVESLTELNPSELGLLEHGSLEHHAHPYLLALSMIPENSKLVVLVLFPIR